MNSTVAQNMYSKTAVIKYLMVGIICLFFSIPAHTQTAQEIDLNSVNVDDLSDAQIENYWKQVQSRGVSLAQLEVLARQRGVSEVQLQKLRSRILSLSQTSGADVNDVPQASGSREVSNLVTGFGIDTNENLPMLTEVEKQIFGFGLFKRQSLSFTPNLSLPTPVDYILGPGDEILIDLWGTTQQFFRFIVSSEGAIRPNKLSPIYVNGLTMRQAESKIINRLSQIYSGLKKSNDQEPSIFYQVSLGKIRTINIEVIGAVENPGIYALPSLATVYTGVHASGGPTISGAFRNVRLIRDNKLKAVVDLYDFLTTGIKVGDERLQDGDVIIIPPYKKRVRLSGRVKIEGLFELVADETLDKVINFANGFTDRAYKDLLTVKRNGKVEKEIYDVYADDFSKFTLEDGDEIEVSQILNRFSNRVVIDGAVYRSGEYELSESMTLRALIEKSGGLRGDAFLQRATIYRMNDDFSRTTIPVDLNTLIGGDSEDIMLEREDQVVIKSIYDLKEEFYVEITGEVGKEGVYAFFNDMTVQDLIILSGGLLQSASGSLIEISRRSKFDGLNTLAEIITLSVDPGLGLTDDELSHKLSPFDKVYIRATPGYEVQSEVTVEGEVLVPGRYTLQKKDERISDMVARAQGLSPYAYPEGAILLRRAEFASNQSELQVNEEYLENLRNKIINSSSGMKTSQREDLLEVLNRIQASQTPPVDYDRLGNRYKRESLDDLGERDSLVTGVEISQNEPVAIDLGKILNNPGSVYDIILKPGDVLSIPGKLETVRVAGEVTSPLNLRYDQSLRFKDYIFQSGGFLERAKRSRSYVIYPNGERKGVKRFLWFKKYPKIRPGSTIIVRRKPERQPINLQAILAAAGSVATLALVVDRLAQN